MVFSESLKSPYNQDEAVLKVESTKVLETFVLFPF